MPEPEAYVEKFHNSYPTGPDAARHVSFFMERTREIERERRRDGKKKVALFFRSLSLCFAALQRSTFTDTFSPFTLSLSLSLSVSHSFLALSSFANTKMLYKKSRSSSVPTATPSTSSTLRSGASPSSPAWRGTSGARRSSAAHPSSSSTTTTSRPPRGARARAARPRRAGASRRRRRPRRWRSTPRSCSSSGL